jgi:hypothetical protein
MAKKTPLERLTSSADLLEKVRAAGAELAISSAGLVGADPYLALVALMLATGHVAAVLKFPYESLVKMITEHYEWVLLQEAEQELADAGAPVVMVRKPEGSV